MYVGVYTSIRTLVSQCPVSEFQGYQTNQAHYKSGTMSQNIILLPDGDYVTIIFKEN